MCGGDDAVLPLPLLYLVQLEHPCLAYRPRFASLGAVKIADELLRCARPGIGRFELLVAVLVDLLAVHELHLKSPLDDGVGWRQIFRILEALVLMIGGHPYADAEASTEAWKGGR